MAHLKLGKRLSSKRCKHDREWKIHECGYSHSSVFGSLSCSQCDGTRIVCASDNHPRAKRRSDW
jgi:hypothetical protein